MKSRQVRRFEERKLPRKAGFTPVPFSTPVTFLPASARRMVRNYAPKPSKSDNPSYRKV